MAIEYIPKDGSGNGFKAKVSVVGEAYSGYDLNKNVCLDIDSAVQLLIYAFQLLERYEKEVTVQIEVVGKISADAGAYIKDRISNG